MKILHKYCIREALSYFLIALGSFTAVLLTIRMLKFATLIIDKGVGFNQIAAVFVAIIPTFLEIAIPLSALLGIMLAYARLSGDSEIVVLRASGVSIYQLVTPTLMFASLILLAAFFVSLYLKPRGYALLSETLFDIAKTKTTSGLEEGIFNQLNVVTIYAENIDDSSGQLSKVMLDDRRDPNLRRIVFAKSGEIFSDTQAKLITIRLSDGEIHEKISGKYTRTNFTSNAIQLSSSELLSGSTRDNSKSSNELSVPQLRESIAYFRQLVELTKTVDPVSPELLPQPRPDWIGTDIFSGKEANRRLIRTETELGSRFSLPFASFILALLALPLGIHPSRAQQTWGVGLSVVTGMLVFVVYYGLFSVGVVLAQSAVINSSLAIWLPNLAALLLAVFFLKKIGSEQWQSAADLTSGLALLAPKRIFEYFKKGRNVPQ